MVHNYKELRMNAQDQARKISAKPEGNENKENHTKINKKKRTLSRGTHILRT